MPLTRNETRGFEWAKLFYDWNFTNASSKHGGEVQAIRGGIWRKVAKQFALVAESGLPGKSVTAKSVMKLLSSNAVVKEGAITFKVKYLERANAICNRSCGRKSPWFSKTTITDPTMKIGKQITVLIQSYYKASKEEADKRAEELLELVVVFQMPKSVWNNISPIPSGGNVNGLSSLLPWSM